MKLEDYRLVDCNLFRKPPVDIDDIKVDITKLLINAWSSNSSVENAIGGILNNSEIVSRLELQISKNMEFQRQQIISKLNTESNLVIEKYEKEKEEGLKTVQGALDPGLSEKEKQVKLLREDESKKYGNYTASQARLEELRARVKTRLKELESGKLEALLVLNRVITNPEPLTEEIEREPIYRGVSVERSLLEKAEKIATADSKYKSPVYRVFKRCLNIVTFGYVKYDKRKK